MSNSKYECPECGTNGPSNIDLARAVGSSHMSLSIMECQCCGNRWEA